jgi:hypothetical protein
MIYLKDVSGEIDQGDILYPIKIKEWLPWWLDKKEYPIIIMTPSCDIFNNKANHHRFPVLEPFPLFVLKISKDITGEDNIDYKSMSKKKYDKIKQKLNQAISNSWPRYHFLPADSNIIKTDRIIDFELLISVPISSFSPGLKVSRLASPFKEELIHRYAHHGMRIGTPDIPKQEVDRIISKHLPTRNI